jgi:hypothetical protein
MMKLSAIKFANTSFVVSSGAALTGLLVIVALVFSFSGGVVNAQQSTATPTGSEEAASTEEADLNGNPICSAARLNVLSELARCQETGKGEACYASDIIRAEPIEAADDFFTTPGDIEPLDAFARLTTSPADDDNWGVALLNLGLFEDLEDNDVQVVLMGDARFEFSEDAEDGYFFSSRDVPCTEAPSAVAIRVPDGENITLTINGAPITVGSTIVLRTTAIGNVMSLMTVEGTVLLSQPEGEIPVVVSEGEVAERCLGAAEDLGLDGIENDQIVNDECGWSAPRLMTLDEQKIAESAIIVFAALDGNFSLTDELVDDPNATAEHGSDSECPNGGQDYVHTVQRGEILFKIAQRYTVTVSQIATDNNITNPDRIFPGQELDIICGIDRGTSTFPPPVTCPATSACLTRTR